MPTFWPRLLLHGVTWLALTLQLPLDVVPWALFLAALYLAGFFVSQLRTRLGGRYQAAAAYLSVVAAIVTLPVVGSHVSPTFLVLLAWLLAAPPLVEVSVRTAERGYVLLNLGLLLVGVAGLAWLLAARGAGGPELAALLLAVVVAAVSTSLFRRSEAERRESRERYSALLSEYRNLKRAAASSAAAARSEERMNVARRLHDSVGHRLTSLLMQLETQRLEAERLGERGEESRQRAEELKRLAQQSLDETRAAVTALSEDELMGMPALLRLITNLEVESAMQVEFTLGSGALNVDLEQAPAIALYRAVQEALTNAMRHGAARRARVKVEVPGGSLVRFEVENDLRPGVTSFEPGFGLTAMRERVEAAGGELEVMAGTSTFLVRGSFPVTA